jgi:uncharacterized protein YjbI with pentapeptide repeats
MSCRQRSCVWALFLAALLFAAAARADIFRWDDGQVIPGTEGIEPGPGLQLENWNTEGRNLSYARLSDLDLAGASFANSWLDYARLESAILSSADLTTANLWGSTLTNANLRQANLTRTHLTAANLTNADLNGADLSNAILWGSELTNADFTDAVVKGANFLRGYNSPQTITKEQLYSTASYQARDLRGIVISANGWGGPVDPVDLSSWNFSGQNLTGADVGCAILVNADLSGANLTNANFHDTTLTNANLARADTRGALGVNLMIAVTTNLIRPDGRIIAPNLAAGERLVAYAGVPVPVKFGSDFSIAPTATFDLTDNDAIVQSSAATKSSDLARLNGFVKQGHNGGDWQGTGITSSTAAADAEEDSTLAIADNALLGYTQFSGQTVTDDSILLKYTYYGDIDLNGQVDADDLTVFANNFGTLTGMTQIDGDTDFDNDVDADDLTIFANNLGGGTGDPLNAAGAQAVPEPAGVVMSCVALLALVMVRVVRRQALLATVVALGLSTSARRGH